MPSGRALMFGKYGVRYSQLLKDLDVEVPVGVDAVDGDLESSDDE